MKICRRLKWMVPYLKYFSGLSFFLKISLKIGGKDTPNPADSKVSWTFHDDPTITVKVDRPPTGLFINP